MSIFSAAHGTPSDDVSRKALLLIQRYIDANGWNWGMARRVINRNLGTQYTIDELKALYTRGKSSTR